MLSDTPAFIIICLTFAPLRFRLKRDVAVRAVEDAARIKTPIVVCHALDRSLVFAGEGQARKTVADDECIIPDTRHRI